MSVIAEFTVPADQFALYETLQSVPEMIVEVERIVAHGPTELMPYFWTSDGDHEAFERAARDDASVENLAKLDKLEEAVLYRANWVRNVETVIYAYTDTGAVLLDATGRSGQWELQLRFDTEPDVTQFIRYIRKNDFTLELHRLYHPSTPTADSAPDLTKEQRETVIAGLQSGYYEIPRQVSSKELADEFGISQQALSKRFRRAHRALAESSFTLTPPDNE